MHWHSIFPDVHSEDKHLVPPIRFWLIQLLMVTLQVENPFEIHVIELLFKTPNRLDMTRSIRSELDRLLGCVHRIGRSTP